MSHRAILELGSPVIIAPYSTLDGTLAWCAVQEAISKGTLSDYDSCLSDLPLAKTKVEDTYFYQASSFFLDEGSEYRFDLAWMHRRFSLESVTEHVPLHKSRIKLDGGSDKNYRLPIYPLVVSRLNFLFEGDADQVARLLRKWLRAIGREAPIGYGAVRSIDVIKDTGNPVLFPDSSVRRPVLQEAVDVLGIKKGRERIAVTSYRPPYVDYHPDRKRICIMPDRNRLMGVA